MAMTKPIVNPVNAFDANNEYTFSFTSIGGNQVVKNEIQIKNNSTEQVVYQHTIESYQFSQTVPSRTLQNGVQYAIAFRTYGTGVSNVSAWSNYIPFYCYSTPTITFNISEGQIIRNAMFKISLTYSQSENELLDYAFIELYDADTNKLVEKSPNLFSGKEPPTTLSYIFQGLLNNKGYKIRAKVITIEQTLVETDFIEFFVLYRKPELYSLLTATPHNCDGYISVNTNYINLEGRTHPQQPYYIDNEKIDCRGADHIINHENTSYNVTWENGFTIREDTLIRMWFNPACIEGNVLYLSSNESEEYLNIEYVRGTQYDYFHLTTNGGTDITSEPFSHNNGTEEYFLWIKVVGNSWEMIVEKLVDTETTILEWNNNNNNVSWNVTMDKVWEDDPTYEDYTPNQEIKVPLHSTFNKVIIGNGVFDHINITNNTNIEYSTEKPYWDFDTILDCDFDGNVNGGNIDEMLKQVSGVKLKRRNENNLTWVTVLEKKVSSVDDLNILYIDYLIPSNVEQTYAFVPILNGGIEGDYIINSVTPKWDGVFITDGDKIFKLYNAVVYDNATQNMQVGVLSPLGSKYPTVIQNSEINYKSGAISCQICGYNFESTKRIDRNDVVKQTNDFLQFLRNGSPKCLIDWNGNDIIFRVIASPSVAYNSYYGNGITNVAFSYAEQGSYDDQESLDELGLTKHILN